MLWYELLHGVHYLGDGAEMESIVVGSRSGTVRCIQSWHRWRKAQISQIPFD